MSALIESKKLDDPEFKWGKKRRLGKKNKHVQFYESFTYDGTDYSLYDCVYMYKQGEPAPYIGKLIKIWEPAAGINKIKVQWFFRPSEISYYLKDAMVLENELFFASGDGEGLANLNPLEAIAGKCNVVCTSTDRRNPPPSAEELQMADYVFYRIFDVKSCTISAHMGDKVGGLEVNFVFNRREGVRILDSLKLDSGEKYEMGNMVACRETQIAGNSSPQQLNNMKLVKNGNHVLEEDTNVRQVPVNHGSLVGKHFSGVDAISSGNREISGTILEERNTVGAKTIESNICENKDDSKDIKSPIGLVQAAKGMKKYLRKSHDLDDAPSKRAKIDGSVSSVLNGVRGLSAPRNDDAAHLMTGATTSKGKLKSGLVKNSVGCRKDVKLAENSSPLDEKLSKTGHAYYDSGLQKNSKSNGNLNALPNPKASSFAKKENLGSARRKDSIVAEKDKKLSGNLSSCGEKSFETNEVSRVETQRPSTTNVLSNQTSKSIPNKEVEGSGQSEKPIHSLPTSMKNPVGIRAQESKEKSNLWHDESREKKEVFGQSEKPSQSLSTSMKRPVEISAQESKEKSNRGHDKSCENKEGAGQAAEPLQSSSTSMKRTLEISVEESKEMLNLVHDKSRENNEGSGQSAKPLQSSSTSLKRTLEISAEASKEKSSIGHDKSLGKEQKVAGNSCPEDERYLKKVKLDDSVNLLDASKNKIENLKENNSLGEIKNSPKCATSTKNNVKSRPDKWPYEYHNAKVKINVRETKVSPKSLTCDTKAKSKLGKGPSKVHHNKKDGKLLNDNLADPLSSKPKDDIGKVGCKIIEVTPRPLDKATWMKFSWDELMKTAHDQGRLVLLQNLDPGYTSGEVEDIIWHTFRENCEARMVPHIAISNPYSGQAFVVFKTRFAAYKVVQKLDDECLMLPNQRPLVACHGILPKTFEKQTTYAGHLVVIDKGRRQIQRDMKEAVSTSHYSQHNTIEFTMAMDWCLLQLQSEKWWGNLHELQRKELKKLGENLKMK